MPHRTTQTSKEKPKKGRHFLSAFDLMSELVHLFQKRYCKLTENIQELIFEFMGLNVLQEAFMLDMHDFIGYFLFAFTSITQIIKFEGTSQWEPIYK